MKKIFIAVLFFSAYLFASINLQTASKEELMSISGIGAKRAAAIIKYRKTHRIKSADDLLKIKGIGKNVVENVKKGVKNKKRTATKKATKYKKKSKVSKKMSKKSQTSKKANEKKKTLQKRKKKVSKKAKSKKS